MRRLIGLLLFCLVGCCASGNGPTHPYKIENVTRVLYGNGYRVVTEDPVTKEVKIIYLDGRTKLIVADVPMGKPAWVYVEKSDTCSISNIYTIHIHSTKDIVGGNTGGKYPTQINVIE
jgi:hypothetical protein